MTKTPMLFLALGKKKILYNLEIQYLGPMKTKNST